MALCCLRKGFPKHCFDRRLFFDRPFAPAPLLQTKRDDLRAQPRLSRQLDGQLKNARKEMFVVLDIANRRKGIASIRSKLARRLIPAVALTSVTSTTLRGCDAARR